MTSTKHEKGDSPFTDDLERNPGIGTSKGAFATGDKPQSIEGDNSVEGDVQNVAEPDGSIDENRLGHTNA